MSEKITVELSDTLLKGIESMIDGVKIRNKEEAVESILHRTLVSEKVKKAVILAGGKGTRMRPFTYEMPKPLIPVQDRPLVQYILDLLAKYNIRDVIFSIGYLGEKVKEHYGNGKKYGFNITYIEEEEALGTAGPLNLMKDKLKEQFIVFNGDILANIDLLDFIVFHTKEDGMATIALTPVKNPSRFGVAILKGNKIKKFIEKPGKTVKYPLINAGIYVMEPEILDYIPEGRAMMEHDVFPQLAKKGMLFGYPFDGQWFDTGTYRSYEKAIKNWKGII